jgi:hypothetical protein
MRQSRAFRPYNLRPLGLDVCLIYAAALQPIDVGGSSGIDPNTNGTPRPCKLRSRMGFITVSRCGTIGRPAAVRFRGRKFGGSTM